MDNYWSTKFLGNKVPYKLHYTVMGGITNLKSCLTVSPDRKGREIMEEILSASLGYNVPLPHKNSSSILQEFYVSIPQIWSIQFR